MHRGLSMGSSGPHRMLSNVLLDSCQHSWTLSNAVKCGRWVPVGQQSVCHAVLIAFWDKLGLTWAGLRSIQTGGLDLCFAQSLSVGKLQGWHPGPCTGGLAIQIQLLDVSPGQLMCLLQGT